MKLKQNYPCKAFEMYLPSDFFRKTFSYAVKNYDVVAVLGAKYGLLFPDDRIARANNACMLKSLV